MKVICDVEANGLNPTQIWVVVCKDIDTGQHHIFRNLTSDPEAKDAFISFIKNCTEVIGHNFLAYDAPVLCRLIGLDHNFLYPIVLDTLVVSKAIDYPRKGHSLEDYGEEFGIEKNTFSDWTKYSQELEDRCVRDTEINHKVYLKYLRYISIASHKASIDLEHKFQYLIVNNLSTKGFFFNTTKAKELLTQVEGILKGLDEELLKEFPPKEELIREFTPKLTKFGTISRTSVPRVLHPNIHEYEADKTYRHTRLVAFNPASVKQVVAVLADSGWAPIEKTDTHVEVERELNKLKRLRAKSPEVALTIEKLYNRYSEFQKVGWKINELNLSTLPASAPSPARTLAQRILYESRRRSLVEWLGLVGPDSRIHGKYYGIGAWTHRMAHQKPNTANIPNEFDIGTGQAKLLGKEMRSLWCAPKGRLLVGVDAEAIQLRVFAHLIDDPELTYAIVHGNKKDKTDPHSLNQKVFGEYCKTRNAAKHSLYAIFFGGRANKVSQIMACSKSDAEEAINKLIQRYPGLARLEKEVFPTDARRGYFIGLDGRKVKIPGDTVSERQHLCMSGYLQNGEKVIMALASVKFQPELAQYDSFLVNLVHDEWQTETPDDREIALKVANLQADSLRIVGEELGLKCPMAGSYLNDHQDHTFGPTWWHTH